MEPNEVAIHGNWRLGFIKPRLLEVLSLRLGETAVHFMASG
jgi:hypothetical protein